MSIQTLLDERGIRYEKHVHPTTYTAQALANVEHVTGYMVAKPVIVKGAHEFAMCVLPAPLHVNLRKVARLMHEPEVRLATEQELVDRCPECERGAEPPLGLLFNMKTIMDKTLKRDDFLVMQAGTHTEAIKLRRADWEKVCKPKVASIAAE